MIVLAMTLISSQVLSASAASVTFSSIPQTYKTLRLVMSPRTDRSTAAASFVNIAFNGSATSHSYRFLRSDSTTAASGSNSNTNAVPAFAASAAQATANTFGSIQVDIPNYANSSAKALSVDSVSENNSSAQYGAYAGLIAGLFDSTSPITSIGVTMDVGPNFVAGSSFYLYGIK